MDTRYNLRSRKRTEKVIPVELQLSSDADFLSHIVGSSHPMPRQVLLDQSFSTSALDLDVSGLLRSVSFSPLFLDPVSMPELCYGHGQAQ